jgi:DNA polymerase III sliding clamp (beta) subunit (PCNA family)
LQTLRNDEEIATRTSQMKIPRDQLATALKPASDILRAKPTQDSPRYLKVEAAKGKLKLSANDSNQSAITEVDCEGGFETVVRAVREPPKSYAAIR